MIVARPLRVGGASRCARRCSRPAARTSRPTGIAYVSYNVAPGRAPAPDAARDGRSGTRAASTDPRERAERARGLFTLLDRLERVRRPRRSTSGVVGEEVHALATAPESMLVHDLLGDAYAPVWFADFAAAAGRHGHGLRRRRDPRGQPRAAVVGGVDGVRRRGGGRATASRASSTSTCSCCGASATRCSAATSGGRRREVDRAAVQRLLVRADELSAAPDALRAALATLPRRSRSRAARALGIAAGELAESLVGGFDVGAVAFHAVPSPGRARGRRAPARERARSQPGAPGRGRHHAAQPGRAHQRRADGALLRLLDGTRDRAAILDGVRPAPARSTRASSSLERGCCAKLAAALRGCRLGA